ncbi:hypothetical protein JQ596_38200 [Bradyrhizobium manausense]|uniref:hypothetical protein n=1 Tax=Bradyrhizobium manausense TaxID=989370 RepID=UPI001BA8C6DC|nr:hypothetical protein [Bradyrhizobium manausense]MBR0831354.1 hypothetical protein [Bradyrhizobium manausense]
MIDPELAEIADKLVPEAGRYLDRHQIERLVRDGISESVARREIRREKSFVKRLETLLPSILQYLKLEGDQDLKRVIHLADDCFHDFPIIVSAPRRDRALRNAISEIKRAKTALLDAATAMSALNFRATDDMDTFLESHLEEIGLGSSFQKFDSFLEHLELRSQILDICLFRAQTDEDYLFLTDNQSKKHVVEAAYHICLWHGGPRLVTTPGSDFSTVCSLLYEIVGGQPTNEGLAGAINRFARSKERREIDDHEREMQQEEEHSDDNFLETKSAARKAEEDLLVYGKLVQEGKKKLGEKQLGIILAALVRSDARRLAALNAYGPHIVWFSDHPSSRSGAFDNQQRKLAAIEERIKAALIALGEARRRQRLT